MDWAVLQGAVAALVIAFAVGLVFVRRPSDVFWPHLPILAVSALVFVSGDVVYELATTRFGSQVGLSAIYTGVLALGLSWWSLVVRFGKASDLPMPLPNPGFERVLYAVGAAIWLLMITNPLHGQFVEVQAGSRSLYHWGFWVHVGFGYLLMFWSLGLLLRIGRRLPSYQSKRQIVILTIAWGGFCAANLVQVLAPRPMPVDITVGAVGFAGVLFIVGFSRAQLFDLAPIVTREVVRRTRDCVLVVDESAKLRYANPAAQGILGKDRVASGRDCGEVLLDFLRPTDLGESRVDATSMRAILEEEHDPPKDHIFFDSCRERFWSLRTEPIRSRRGKLIFRSLTLRDVTLQIQAEQVLKRDHEELEKLVAERTAELSRANDEKDRILDALGHSEARYRELISDAPLGVVACNRDGDLIAANPRFWSILGIEAPDESGPPDVLRYEPLVEAGLSGMLQRCIDTGERQRRELQCSLRSGRVVDLRLHAAPLWDGDFRVQGVQAILEDVTDQAQATRELTRQRDRLEALVQRQSVALEQSRDHLRRSERLSSVGILAAGVAHQINNPIGAILGAAEYALCCERDEEAMRIFREALKDNVAQATRCGQIVRSLLQFSRGESTPMVEEDLNEIVQRACYATEAYAMSRAGRVTPRFSPEPLPVLLSPIQIEQVFVNVIRNALESCAAGVAVDVRSERLADCVRVSIRDNGAGIDAESLEHVFDPFFTTRNHEGGTGLGLSVAHGIVLMHGGSMRAESEVGVGTTVTIELPYASKDDARADGT